MNRINLSNGRNFKADYTFSEYPKWVTLADGSQVIVHDEDEEASAMGADEADAPSLREEIAERERLFAEAKSLGLKPHHKMRPERLRELINSAKE
ncbi:hypothetical protein QZM15_16230 [Burkholderia sp. AU44665]|uniref:hypothetical protein n=1 Tax=Burkholderia sp. AU44665 TaxID=3059203 RepID=UPI00265F8658|nr:hypothetical protein [Burkholderia sp. AU44665]MDN7700019.1 hypothetical protein [Burkholderia sp. AU44665]